MSCDHLLEAHGPEALSRFTENVDLEMAAERRPLRSMLDLLSALSGTHLQIPGKPTSSGSDGGAGVRLRPQDAPIVEVPATVRVDRSLVMDMETSEL